MGKWDMIWFDMRWLWLWEDYNKEVVSSSSWYGDKKGNELTNKEEEEEDGKLWDEIWWLFVDDFFFFLICLSDGKWWDVDDVGLKSSSMSSKKTIQIEMRKKEMRDESDQMNLTSTISSPRPLYNLII